MTNAPLALVAVAALAVPFPASAGDRDQLRAIGQGRALYLAHCASCHGPAGRGAEGVPDLTRIEARDGAFDPVHVAKHVDGRRLGRASSRMPRWGEHFARRWPYGEAWSAAQVWTLTRYLDFVQEPSPALAGSRSRRDR
jgi:mono/diheme cytochrome c family protein